MNGTRPDKSKLYYPKMPATWWLRKPRYFLFMLRELSSVFIAIFLIVFLIQIYQLTDSSDTRMDDLPHRSPIVCLVSQHYLVLLLGHCPASTDWRAHNSTECGCRLKHRRLDSRIAGYPGIVSCISRLKCDW